MGVSRLRAQKKEYWANVKVVTAGSSCHSWKRKRWEMAEPRGVEEPWRAEEEVLPSCCWRLWCSAEGP